MKKLTLSLVAMLAMGIAAMAESYPAYGPDSYKALHDPDPDPTTATMQDSTTNKGFYLGLAYGLINADIDVSIAQQFVGQLELEADLNTIMFQTGYRFNQYIAIEGRLWRAFGDIDVTRRSSNDPSMNGSFSSESDGEYQYGIYIKPMYPIMKELDIYALLGYARTDELFADDSGFSWGLGTSYSINNNISIFVDYVKLYDDDALDTYYGYDSNVEYFMDSWNFGITLKF